MIPEEIALTEATKILVACGYRATGKPRLRRTGTWAYFWPCGDVSCVLTLPRRGAGYMAQYVFTKKPQAHGPLPVLAERVARALAIPAGIRCVVNPTSVFWQREVATPDRSPCVIVSPPILFLLFAQKTGELISATRYVHKLTFAPLPTHRITSMQAEKTVATLLAPLPPNTGVPPDRRRTTPVLHWVPFQEVLTLNAVQQRIQRAGLWTREDEMNLGPLQLAWLVRKNYCLIGVAVDTGQPIYFEWQGGAA
jgi:hypothetical protein